MLRGTNILEHYEYDANGNRKFATGASPTDTASASFDGQDLLTRYKNTRYLNGTNGELGRRIAGTDTTLYTYDELGNLLSVRLPNHDLISYIIDGRSRRVGKKVNGVFKQGWLYQNGLNVVAELDSTKAVVARYVYGSRAHVPDYLVKGGTTYRLITDQLGSVRLVVNASNGAVAESLSYDTWGKVKADKSPGFISLGYAGGIYDAQTGLVRFGARDYDPSVGRWLSKDPILFAGGSTNLLAYVDGDPVNSIDPSGTDAQDDLNSIAGFADLLSGGLTGKIRDQYFSYNSIDKCSEAYLSGRRDGLDLIIYGATVPVGEILVGALGAVLATEAGEAAARAGERLVAGRISGYTGHGIESAIFHDGVGVAPRAILDAVRNPTRIVLQDGGKVLYKGRQAYVVLSREGRVITTFARTRAAWRVVP